MVNLEAIIGSLSLSKISRGRFSLLPEVSRRGVAGASIEGRTSFCVDWVADSNFADEVGGALPFPLPRFGLGMVIRDSKSVGIRLERGVGSRVAF
jgi:hypothetical protein